MSLKALETVVLERDVPEHSLKCGDVGVVVELYEPDGVEVEFVTGSGHTQAVVTLRRGDIRTVRRSEILAVRDLSPA